MPSNSKHSIIFGIFSLCSPPPPPIPLATLSVLIGFTQKLKLLTKLEAFLCLPTLHCSASTELNK